MNSTLKQRYLAYYSPLITDFIREVETLQINFESQTPQPFFPVFGEDYENSPLRLAIVGQDTRGWGCLSNFISQEKTHPGSALEADFQEFRGHDFKGWGTTRYTFWGFAMMFLAALHGKSDWGVMKKGGYPEILSSFAWANGNAIEYFGSSPKQKKKKKWELIRRAGERFNGVRHLVEALRPQVLVVLWKEMKPESFLAGYKYIVSIR